MKRLKTRRQYHDSQLIHAEWEQERNLRLTFRLDGHWNDGVSLEASVLFSGVRNRDEVEPLLRSLADAEVVGIARHTERAFLIDTSKGALIIDASGFSEI